MMSKAYFVAISPTEVDKEQLKVQARRYAITPAGFINYAGAEGSIQQHPKGASGWSVVSSFTTDSSGQFFIQVPYPTVDTDYRVVLDDAQYIFGSISQSVNVIGRPCCTRSTGS